MMRRGSSKLPHRYVQAKARYARQLQTAVKVLRQRLEKKVKP